jgi:hypothetical protein
MEVCDIRTIIKSLNVARRILMALQSLNYFMSIASGLWRDEVEMEPPLKTPEYRT